MASTGAGIYRAPIALVLLAFAGSVTALIGGYWDDAWHTERGRDEFFIAPHIAIYAGIAVAGAALTLWAFLAGRRDGPRAVWLHKPLALGLLSVSVTLASGPIDNLWHVAFGRDAVIWSPPHMLGIAGTLALAASVLAELASRPERWAAPLSLVAGAMVIAPAAFATVEYDTDVPQFSELWYLPALGFAAAIAMAMIRTVGTRRWATTISAAIYTAFIAGVGVFLWALDFSAPALPLLVIPALAVDLGARRGWPAALTGLAFSVLLYAAYVPARNWLGSGVEISATDVAIGLPLTTFAAWLVFTVASGAVPAKRTVAAGVATAALVVPTAALGHDPGQGDEAGIADVAVALDGSHATLTVGLPPEPCDRSTPGAIVARRAGETLRGPLTQSGCRFQGTLELPERGRWFVYAELKREGRTVETWLPISVGSGSQRVAEQGRYVYYPADRAGGGVKLLAGVVLYTGMLALFAAAFSLIRRPAVSA